MSTKTEELKAARVSDLMHGRGYRFVYFKGADLMSGPQTHGFVPFDSRIFGRLVQDQTPGTSENMTKDLEKTVRTLADDWSWTDRYICFYDRVWDRQDLCFVDNQLEFVYATDVKLSDNTEPAWQFFLQLSQGDEALARDYIQAIAPLFMMDKPTGIIWFVGDGANGKSALLKALYKAFKKYFVSLTTADLEDGRDVPSMRGVLGNIVLESSEARVVDSKAYKSIGAHEDLRVHEFQKQGGIVVESTFHSIFNANNIPIFADKTGAIKRRTMTIPFLAHFKDNPTFERDTFTPDFLGGLFKLFLDMTVEIRSSGNQYQWSPATRAMQQQYNDSVNSAEAFVGYLVDHKILGVFNYTFLERNYRDWCSREGHIPLSIQTLKREVVARLGMHEKTVRDSGRSFKRRVFDEAFEAGDNLIWEAGTGFGVATPVEGVRIPAQTAINKEWME